jgi:hypothetical protein
VTSVTPTTIQVRTPTGSGLAAVTLSNANGTATLPSAYAYVDPALAARFGNVNVALGDRENVLLVNGSAGDANREITLAVGQPFSIGVASPSSRASATFAFYAWAGASSGATLAVQPAGLGIAVFPTPLNGPPPASLKKIANNTGYRALGAANLASTPAPTTLVNRPTGWPRQVTVTLQAILQDLGSQSSSGFSMSNAVVLHVQ